MGSSVKLLFTSMYDCCFAHIEFSVSKCRQIIRGEVARVVCRIFQAFTDKRAFRRRRQGQVQC